MRASNTPMGAVRRQARRSQQLPGSWLGPCVSLMSPGFGNASRNTTTIAHIFAETTLHETNANSGFNAEARRAAAPCVDCARIQCTLPSTGLSSRICQTAPGQAISHHFQT